MPRGKKRNPSAVPQPEQQSEIERFSQRGVRPSAIRRWDTSDPDWANDRRIRWLENHHELLGEFQRRLNQRELDRLAKNTRKARILENGYEFYSLTQVLVLYGKNCHICGVRIDLRASRRAGIGDWLLGLHIDHVVPIVKGGPDTLGNVRPSHAICNLKKGVSLTGRGCS